MTEISREHKTNKDHLHEEFIEERIVKATGDIQIRRYIKGRLLGKGGFAKCYEITNVDSNRTCAVKIVQKGSLNRSRAKQKLISEIKIHKVSTTQISLISNIISKTQKMCIFY